MILLLHSAYLPCNVLLLSSPGDGHMEEQPITPAYGNLSNSMDLKQQQHRRSFEVPSPSFVVGSAPSGMNFGFDLV